MLMNQFAAYKAEAIVVVVARGEGTPTEQAKAQIAEKFKKEAAKSEGEDAAVTKFEDVRKPLIETPLPENGPAMARYQKVNSLDPTLQFLIVTSAIEVDGKLVFVYSWSHLRSAQFMQPFMLKLAGSLKKKSGFAPGLPAWVLRSGHAERGRIFFSRSPA